MLTMGGSHVEGDTQSFVVRIWHEEADEEGNAIAWRGSVDHVGSKKRFHFQDLGQLVHFIRQMARLPERNLGCLSRGLRRVYLAARRALIHLRLKDVEQ